MVPVKIDIDGGTLVIIWNDNKRSSIKLANLRRKCPCAVCQNEIEEKGNSYIPIYTKDQLTIIEIIPNGNYAVNICWKDGHTIGIYEFGYLRKISDKVEDIDNL